MKKLLLFIALPFMFLTLSAQITQEQADVIAIEHLGNVASNFILYAKEDVQTGFEIITTTGEILELTYPCWVYYVNFTDETYNKYLIIKENNGNVLEMNVKYDEGPDNFEIWRILLLMEIPFEEYSLEGTSCQWINLNYDETVMIINSDEELEQYISCIEDSYPAIDFSIYTLLIAQGKATSSVVCSNCNRLLQLSEHNYKMNVDISLGLATVISYWQVPIIVRKLSTGCTIDLIVTFN